MLGIHAEPQGLLAIRIERKQVKKTVGAAVKHTPLQIYGRINERLSRSALLRLDVVGVAGDRHVGIVAKSHLCIHSGPRIGRSKPRRKFPLELTERLLNRIIAI